MWSIECFDTDVYHLVAAFIIYSVLGWFVESIYMSFCNRKITNRGFAKGPFCPIYGFGAVAGYLVLSPLRENYIALYIVGAITATIFEFMVGIGMKRFLGALWWDYNDKPLNYKGIICLESTIAWGFYAIIVVRFLHGFIMETIDRYNFVYNRYIIMMILFIVFIDYSVQLCKVFDVKVKEKIIEKYMAIRARWN